MAPKKKKRPSLALVPKPHGSGAVTDSFLELADTFAGTSSALADMADGYKMVRAAYLLASASEQAVVRGLMPALTRAEAVSTEALANMLRVRKELAKLIEEVSA